MTREEEIKRASVMYHLYYYDYSYEEGEHLDFYIKGFTEGAMWADEHPINVWHDAIDSPTDIQRSILFLTNEGHFGLIMLRNGSYWFEYKHFDSWKEFLENYKVERWCYTDEII